MTGSPTSPWRQLVAALRRRLPWWPQPGRLQPEENRSDQLDQEIAQFQQRLVEAAFSDDGGVGGIPFGKGGSETAYLAHPARVLVRERDRADLDAFFDERTEIYEGRGRTEDVVPGELVGYELPTRRVDGGRDARATLDEIEEVLGRDVVMPDHIVYVTPQGIGKLCPAGEPELPLGKGPVPALTDKSQAGDGILVSVVDTGWYRAGSRNPETPWLRDRILGDEETVDPEDIHSYAGHGNFVGGVIRCLAPATELDFEGVLTRAGAVYESVIARELNEALTSQNRPDLISVSAGCYTRNNAGLLAFTILMELFNLADGADAPLVVAAAGNDASDRPFFPAAYRWVTAVGALEEDMSVAAFSNVGDWVDVYAHGSKLVNAFPTGTYFCKEPGPTQGEQRDFTGLAQWSGTSFATPIVTGAVAAHMTESGETSPRAAVEALIAGGRPFTDSRVPQGVAVGPPFI